MSAAIEVKRETAEKLLLLAKGTGLSVDELLRRYVPGLSEAEVSSSTSNSQRAQAFIEWAGSHRGSAPPLNDHAVRRKSFYE